MLTSHLLRLIRSTVQKALAHSTFARRTRALSLLPKWMAADMSAICALVRLMCLVLPGLVKQLNLLLPKWEQNFRAFRRFAINFGQASMHSLVRSTSMDL